MRIPARFNGPPGSGNGGWCAGVFAAAAGAAPGGAAYQVTLRRPPPLEVDLDLRDTAVYAGDELIAEIVGVPDAGPGVAAVGWDTAVAAARDYPGFTGHPFPTCFVCGPERAEGDGLRIFPGPLPDGRTAAPWTVPDEVRLPLLWAALDCPGGWTAIRPGHTYLLGRIAVAVDRLPDPGARCVITGAVSEVHGRKALVDSTAYGPDGRRLAVARATWIRTG
ncbi:hypothetical protein [Actinoplanes teichomyceticus]|uniref:Thioesterase superfamily protein n=1 Tax=Actinoplanes teichomyceticus TaxID=1867 RepID=A0A561WP33_ACTTI|nr:hypothetical protein [Actinoplanes teichomyceticus]TWG25624.1 hypothetical protein FHX34_101594 [Actinoplanes teichomyceticus]GIF10698.1 hypothetical protein Ate01nite_07300 [Actinoplanes teichomyceticus]